MHAITPCASCVDHVFQVEDQPILSHIPYFGDNQDHFINEMAEGYEGVLVGSDNELPGCYRVFTDLPI